MKKLNLDELKVNSFVTSINQKEEKTIKGGAVTDECPNPGRSEATICPPHDFTEPIICPVEPKTEGWPSCIEQ